MKLRLEEAKLLMTILCDIKSKDRFADRKREIQNVYSRLFDFVKASPKQAKKKNVINQPTN